ncbi:hypothetical protein N9L07_00900 [Flavobacteriaceae bacterium]|nr:hypothetical protein [Flavobacteriaceae bacterium]
MKNLRIIPVLYPYESFEKAKLAFENAFSPSAKFQKKTVPFCLKKVIENSSSQTTKIYTNGSPQEIGSIINPLDNFYKSKVQLYANRGSIVEKIKI